MPRYLQTVLRTSIITFCSTRNTCTSAQTFSMVSSEIMLKYMRNTYNLLILIRKFRNTKWHLHYLRWQLLYQITLPICFCTRNISM